MKFPAALAALTFATSALAQAPDARLPRIDPASRLEGPALVAALREGGYVLFMRHARQVNPQPEDCSPRNLSAEGQAEASKVGQALRALKIPIGAVRASPLCRASITARLMEVGAVEETENLMPSILPDIQAGRGKLLAEAPRAGTNTLLLSHVQGGENEVDRVQYDYAEVIVYRPDGRGGAAPVARVKAQDWNALQ